MEELNFEPETRRPVEFTTLVEVFWDKVKTA